MLLALVRQVAMLGVAARERVPAASKGVIMDTYDTVRFVTLDRLCAGLDDRFRDHVADSIDCANGDPNAIHTLVSREMLFDEIRHGFLSADYDDNDEFASQIVELQTRIKWLPADVLIDIES